MVELVDTLVLETRAARHWGFESLSRYQIFKELSMWSEAITWGGLLWLGLVLLAAVPFLKGFFGRMWKDFKGRK